jgi:hypothetical protein
VDYWVDFRVWVDFEYWVCFHWFSRFTFQARFCFDLNLITAWDHFIENFNRLKAFFKDPYLNACFSKISKERELQYLHYCYSIVSKKSVCFPFHWYSTLIHSILHLHCFNSSTHKNPGYFGCSLSSTCIHSFWGWTVHQWKTMAKCWCFDWRLDSGGWETTLLNGESMCLRWMRKEEGDYHCF